jgi:hypothetical protein
MPESGRGQIRSTTILVATDGQEHVYRSFEEMPASLRRRLLRSTQSENAATILIADPAGEKYLEAVVRPEMTARHEPPPAPPQPNAFWRPGGWRFAVEAAVCGGAALVLWLLATLR